MGEEFIRRRNDRFTRLRDERLRNANAGDLFSTCAPEEQVEVCGYLRSDARVAENEAVWTPSSTDPTDDAAVFYSGKTPVAEVPRSTLRGICSAPDAPLVGVVTSVHADEQLLSIRVRTTSTK